MYSEEQKIKLAWQKNRKWIFSKCHNAVEYREEIRRTGSKKSSSASGGMTPADMSDPYRRRMEEDEASSADQ